MLLRTTIVLFLAFNAAFASKNYRRLMRDKLRRYSRIGTPVLFSNDTTVVQFGFRLEDFRVVDSESILETDGFLFFVWEDSYMKWNPDDYGGIDKIRFPTYAIWTPDIDAINGDSSGRKKKSRLNLELVVYSTGTIYWVRLETFRVYCDYDFTNYPYDEQQCDIMLGSWLYSKNEVQLEPPYHMYNATKFMDIGSDADFNPNWKFKSISEVKRNFGSSEKTYESILVTLKFARRSSRYAASVLTPIGVCIVLVLMMFWIPAWHNSRLLTGVIAIVGISFIMTHLHWTLPPLRAVPKIIQLCHNTMIAVCASVFLSVITTTLVEKSLPEPPAALVNLLQGIIGKILCIYDEKTSEAPTTHGVFQRSQMDGKDDKVYVGDVTSAQTGDKWHLITLALDRILFVVFSAVFIITSTN